MKNSEDIKNWVKSALKMSPSRRIFIAFILGTLQAASIYALLMDWNGREAYLLLIQERWVEMHWGWWVGLWALTVYLYARNSSKFDKETLWMTIKNPAKVTREEGDSIFPNPLAPPTASTMRPMRPPPPPRPPTSRNISGSK